jgi:hypothetical protein
MMPESARDALFARVCDGRATAEEIAELHRQLRSDPGMLDEWLHYSSLHADLAAGSVLPARAQPMTPARFQSPAGDAAPAVARDGIHRLRFPWAPQAAAGLVLGLCAATLVWAYVAPIPPKPVTLLQEDFESPALTLATKAALEPGTWRGDAAAIVGPQHGISPSSDARMLRLRREEFDGPAKPAGGHIAVAYRLIDLRPYRQEIAGGGGVVEVSASFNAEGFPEDERYGCAISLYALDASSVPERAGRLGSVLSNEALAMARSSRTMLDREPAAWQRVTTELRLPPQAEFLAVRLHISQAFESTSEAAFAGSYVDDVHVSLTVRPPLP